MKLRHYPAIAAAAVVLAGCSMTATTATPHNTGSATAHALRTWLAGPGGAAAKRVTRDAQQIHAAVLRHNQAAVRAAGTRLYNDALAAYTMPPPAGGPTYQHAMLYYTAAGAFYSDGAIGAGNTDATTAASLTGQFTRMSGQHIPAAGPAATGIVLTAAASPAPRRCTMPHIAVTVTHPAAAAGTAHWQLRFTSTSGRLCFLAGYPGVSAATSPAGPAVGAAATWNPQTVPHPVVLARGQAATATLAIATAGNYPPRRCHPATEPGIRVYPPDAYDPAWLPFPVTVCQRTRAGVLSVTAVTRAPS